MAEALILDSEAVNALAHPTARRVLAERAATIFESLTKSGRSFGCQRPCWRKCAEVFDMTRPLIIC